MASFTPPLNFIRSTLSRASKFYDSPVGVRGRRAAFRAAKWGAGKANYYATHPTTDKARAVSAAMAGSIRRNPMMAAPILGAAAVGAAGGAAADGRGHRMRGAAAGAALGGLGMAGYGYGRMWNRATPAIRGVFGRGPRGLLR